MPTTKADIQNWFDVGLLKGHKWLLVVCDTFSYEDYPVYANTVEEFDHKYAEHNSKNMQRIMETYDLSKEPDLQLKQHRTWEYPENSRFKPMPDDPIAKWLE